MTMEQDFEKAAGLEMVAIWSQYPAESGRNGPQVGLTAQRKSPEKPGSAEPCDKPRRLKVEDNGLEPMTFWLPARRSPN